MATRKILEKSRPVVSVADFPLAQITEFLAGKLAGKNVIKAYLIGSVAAGNTHHWSDIDVLIIKETTKPFPERALEFVDLFELGVAVDILVYTPAELCRMERDPTAFWKNAMRNRIQVL